MRPVRRLLLLLALVALTCVGAAAPATATGHALPATIPLPDGFRPEGIAIARSGAVYVGSIPTGAIWRGDVRTGKGSVLVPGVPGRAAIGLELDSHGRLWVAGGPTGHAFVYDARTGRLLADYQLTTGTTFVNDVVVTRHAAWFTDSTNPRLYRVPIGRHGRLGDQGDVTALALSGEIAYDPMGPNANGIEAARGGRVLIIVQSNKGLLFTVNPRSGVARTIDLGGENVLNGDGLLLRGRTLYVVQNLRNLIAKVRLGRSLATGRVVERISDPDFDVPTTLASFKGRLYTVNARFTTPPTPQTSYDIVRVDGR
jgi:Strictosidine synthase-like, N-terminal